MSNELPFGALGTCRRVPRHPTFIAERIVMERVKQPNVVAFFRRHVRPIVGEFRSSRYASVNIIGIYRNFLAGSGSRRVQY